MSPPHDHVDYIGHAPTGTMAHDDLRGTELRLGLPGSESSDGRPTAATPTLDLLPPKGAKRVFAHEAQVPPAAASGDGNQAESEVRGEGDKKVAAPPQPAAKWVPPADSLWLWMSRGMWDAGCVDGRSPFGFWGVVGAIIFCFSTQIWPVAAIGWV